MRTRSLGESPTRGLADLGLDFGLGSGTSEGEEIAPYLELLPPPPPPVPVRRLASDLPDDLRPIQTTVGVLGWLVNRDGVVAKKV